MWIAAIFPSTNKSQLRDIDCNRNSSRFDNSFTSLYDLSIQIESSFLSYLFSESNFNFNFTVAHSRSNQLSYKKNTCIKTNMKFNSYSYTCSKFSKEI